MNPTEQEKPAVSDVGGEIDLLILIRMIWAHRILIGCVSLTFGVLAAIYAFTARPEFRAETSLTDAPDGSMGAAASLMNQFGGLASLAGINVSGGDHKMRDARAVLKSRALAEEFIARRKLVDVILENADQRTLWRAVERFRKSVVTIREDNRAGLVLVTIDWRDAEVAADWANAYVALANEIIRRRALEEATRNIAYLNEQLTKTNSIEVQRVMFNLIENETKNSMLASGREEYAFAVVDRARVPEIRVSPKRALLVLGGLIFGGIIGSIFVFVRRAARPKV